MRGCLVTKAHLVFGIIAQGTQVAFLIYKVYRPFSIKPRVRTIIGISLNLRTKIH